MTAAPTSRSQDLESARGARASSGPRLLWSPDDTDPGWFHTAEWEMAADWDVPQTSAWESVDPADSAPGELVVDITDAAIAAAEVVAPSSAGWAGVSDTAELPVWLAAPETFAPVHDAPPTAALPRTSLPGTPLPRRRDLRAGGTHHTLPARREVADLPLTGSVLLPEVPDGVFPPAAIAHGGTTILPRRRDLRRGRQLLVLPASTTAMLPPAPGALAVTGDGLGEVETASVAPPATGELRRPRTRQPEQPSRVATTVARAGVVSVLVAVGVATVGGQHFGLGTQDGRGAVDGMGVVGTVSPADAAAAMQNAPIRNAPVTLWLPGSGNGDVMPKFASDTGAAARGGLAGAQSSVASMAEEIKAQQARVAAEKAKKDKAAADLAAKNHEGAAGTASRWTGSSSSVRGIARSMMLSEYGWGDGQFQCLNLLWNRESGWNPNAHNRSSGAHGIPQALPGRKMASAGSDWRTNPATQIEWGLDYIHDRYGTPCSAWAHSESHGSY